MKLTPQKLEGWGYLWWKFDNPNFNRFCYDTPVWQTDGRAGDSI